MIPALFSDLSWINKDVTKGGGVYIRGVNLYGLWIFAIYMGLRAYDAILTDIYDFCRFKLTIIPDFLFELLSVCNDTSYAL